ncbi:hypothetical protein [Roseovarius nanhaiticus]|nr:hypothetical protein [Roseovarius nanhaiticus]
MIREMDAPSFVVTGAFLATFVAGDAVQDILPTPSSWSQIV